MTVVSISVPGGDTHPAPVADGGELRGAAVVLAIGHTASRDAYPALAVQGVAMVPKPFALGFRMEHPQALIDELQLGARLAEGARPSFSGSPSFPSNSWHDIPSVLVCPCPMVATTSLCSGCQRWTRIPSLT